MRAPHYSEKLSQRNTPLQGTRPRENALLMGESLSVSLLQWYPAAPYVTIQSNTNRALIPMPVLRFLASLFLLVAVITLAADATPPLSGSGPFAPTSLAKHWEDIAPATLASAKARIETASSLGWNFVVQPLISMPTFLLFGLLGLLAGYAGRRRRKVNIYIN